MATMLCFALSCFLMFAACLVYAAPGFGERPSQDFDKELTETLQELLEREEPKEEEADLPDNTAGEYLGDDFNHHHKKASHWRQELNDAGGIDMDKVEDLMREGEKEEEVEQIEDDEEKEEARKGRLQNLYSMLLGLYNRHLRHQEIVSTEDSPFDQVLGGDSSSHAHGTQTESGQFGKFLDGDRKVGPSDAKMRQSVLAAIEKRLQGDLKDARSVGISVDDLIQDLQHKASEARTAHLRQIEEELSRLSDRKG